MRMSDSVGLLQVFIEDPVNGSRETSALIPVPVNMDAGSVCKFAILNYMSFEMTNIVFNPRELDYIYVWTIIAI